MFNHRHRLILVVVAGVAAGFYLGTLIVAPRPPRPEEPARAETVVLAPGREAGKPTDEPKDEFHLGFWAEAELEVRAEAQRTKRRVPFLVFRPGTTGDAAGPRYAEVELRERQMQSGEYHRLVAEGRQPARYPAEKRKALYAEFARGTRLTEPWSLLVPFDELSAPEMDDALAALRQVEFAGPASLTPAQRSLLLKAGAREVSGYVGL